MEKALNAFDVSLAENAYIANCRVKLEKEKRVQPGVMAYDFTLEDLEGNTYKLSDYRENMYCWSLVHLGADGVNWRYLSLKRFIRIRKVRILSCLRLIWMTSEGNGRKM